MPRRSPAVPTPYTVALFAPPKGYGALAADLYDFHRDRSIRAVRAGNLRRGRDYFTVWKFQTEALAEEFKERFGGERLAKTE